MIFKQDLIYQICSINHLEQRWIHSSSFHNKQRTKYSASEMTLHLRNYSSSYTLCQVPPYSTHQYCPTETIAPPYSTNIYHNCTTIHQPFMSRPRHISITIQHISEGQTDNQRKHLWYTDTRLIHPSTYIFLSTTTSTALIHIPTTHRPHSPLPHTQCVPPPTHPTFIPVNCRLQVV